MKTAPYYLLALRDHIRENNSLFSTKSESNNNIRIMPDERPFPGCGNLFIGLRIGTQRMDKKVLPKRSELCEIVLSVTLRTVTTPYITVGESFYVRDDASVNFQASLAHVCVHLVDLVESDAYRDELMGRVQTLICEQEGENASPATGVLRWKNSLSQIRIVGSEHFIEHSENTNTRSDSGLLDILTFGDGERLV